jgi:S-adenosylmethionine hydrolase
MAERAGIVTLTTDFGIEDAYVAALEAAVLAEAPQARVVHVSHQVSPGNVLSGAYLVEYAARSFPPATVHLAVVDPGVGTDRPMVGLESGGSLLVGPDNGLLERARRGAGAGTAVQLQPPPDPGGWTFQSRDVMAPAAGRLARGVPLADLGTTRPMDPVEPAPSLQPSGPRTVQVAHVDRFGTLVLDLLHPGSWPDGPTYLLVNNERAALGRTFGDVDPGRFVAYKGSIGYIEVARRDASAAVSLGVRPGSAVEVVLA